MDLNSALHSAIKEGMTVFICSNLVSPQIFEELVGSQGKVIGGMPVKNDVDMDVLFVSAEYSTLSMLKRAEEALTLSRPIVFVSVRILKSYTYSMKDILDYMISIGYMNMKLGSGQYVFTYEHHPSTVLL